ncbi:hypothetical protein ACFO8O_01635 [Hephaestia sp. GCM10023244]|uniref:hypothetical protein n=1 Tax=unclassified Hephaestia TaxID=2631281 RepID=UPI0020778773|nr:hypothetical protein [Hephaestia sp. MAHUQ-44]MCM8729673.1 hypothetical protein [Hephaestia sp. MAHUQ-44]
MEEALGSWRQEGRISLWRYRRAPKRYDGWHFTADQDGCASLIGLFDILSSATEPAYRTLSVTDPREVGADHIFGDHDLRLDVPAKLRLGNDLDGTGTIGLSVDVFAMPLRPEDISNLSEAVKDVSSDHADFGVGFGRSGTIVNFWWWPKKRKG